MKLYYYAKSNQMDEHGFSDDVAITMAISKRKALNKFRKYYKDATTDDVVRIKRRKLRDVVVLTDY